MRDFSFVKTDRPTMAEFNKRFDDIAYIVNNLGNEYVWAKQETRQTPVLGSENVATFNNLTITYGSEVEIVNGTVSIKNVTTTTNNNDLYNKYFYISDASNIIFVGYCTSVSGSTVRYKRVEVSSSLATVGYVNSSDPNAYPIDDGYTYTAVGQLGNKAQMATGSYKGTGLVGPSNPCVLSVGFAPKLVIVCSNYFPEKGNYGWKATGFVWVSPITKDRIDYNADADPYRLHFTVTENAFSFNLGANQSDYSNTLGGMAANYQCNASGTTYYYLAIG